MTYASQREKTGPLFRAMHSLLQASRYLGHLSAWGNVQTFQITAQMQVDYG